MGPNPRRRTVPGRRVEPLQWLPPDRFPSVGVVVGTGVSFYLVQSRSGRPPRWTRCGTWSAVGIVGIAAIGVVAFDLNSRPRRTQNRAHRRRGVRPQRRLWDVPPTEGSVEILRDSEQTDPHPEATVQTRRYLTSSSGVVSRQRHARPSVRTELLYSH